MPLTLLLAAAVIADAAAPEDIVITAERGQSRVLPPTAELGGEQLMERQPRSAADAVEALPGIAVRTNSRGETVARARGSEERQTQVFLDGAPLAVPWDGRADLGVLPAGLIEAVRATKGAVPLEYGANAVAGAIDLETRSGGLAAVRAMGSAGSLGFADGALVTTLPIEGVDLTLAAAGLRRGAEPVASVGALPFSQPASNRRLNTDLRSVSAFGAASLERGPVAVRAGLLHFDARRGIAPESDRDPAVNAPRYWRYPDIRQTQLNLASRLKLSDRTSLRAVAWRQWFGQTIVQFTDASYSVAQSRQQDRDDTTGGRLVLSTAIEPVSFRLVATGQTSRHQQRDQPLPRTSPAPELAYRQNLFTIGGEADVPIGAARATIGIAYDHSANPLTGDKPSQPAGGALALSAALSRPLNGGWTVTASSGRRNRFPTSRELFGEALGRFLTNRELRPERALLADLDLAYADAGITARINPFASRVRDTIAQRVVVVDGRSLRQRYNLAGSMTYGIDLAAAVRVSPGLRVESDATVLRARADAGTAPFRRLPQRPSLDLRGAVVVDPTSTLSLRAELRHVGSAVDLAPNGSRARLSPGNEVNLRARWQVGELWRRTRLSLTASADNLTDAVIVPQLGLPLPGRSLRIGFSVD